MTTSTKSLTELALSSIQEGIVSALETVSETTKKKRTTETAETEAEVRDARRTLSELLIKKGEAETSANIRAVKARAGAREHQSEAQRKGLMVPPPKSPHAPPPPSTPSALYVELVHEALADFREQQLEETV